LTLRSVIASGSFFSTGILAITRCFTSCAVVAVKATATDTSPNTNKVTEINLKLVKARWLTAITSWPLGYLSALYARVSGMSTVLWKYLRGSKDARIHSAQHIISRAVFIGLENAVREIRDAIASA
jgi:hypothetical protein